MEFKKVNRYQVRYWPKFPSVAFSRPVGSKGRLMNFHAAKRVQARLKKRGVDVFLEKLVLKEAKLTK